MFGRCFNGFQNFEFKNTSTDQDPIFDFFVRGCFDKSHNSKTTN